MASGQPRGVSLKETAAAQRVRYALDLLATVTHRVISLFDESGELVGGPVAGTALARLMLTTSAGRDHLIRLQLDAAHGRPGPDASTASGSQEADVVVAPVLDVEQVLGLLVAGGDPRASLTPENGERFAADIGIPLDGLRDAASRPPAPMSSAETLQLLELTAALLAEVATQDRALRLRIEELGAVYNIAALLSGTRDLQDILSKAARTVCQVMNVKACSIRLLDEATGSLTIKAVHNLSAEYLNKGPVRVRENPIDASAVRGMIVRIADAPNDPRTRYPDQARREGIVSGLVSGMIYRGKPVGVIRVYTGEPHVFSPFEESLLIAIASQAAAAIVNARLLDETIEAERYARQIAYAGEVQRRMIPSTPPQLPAFDIGTVYRPTFEVGGDFFDFVHLPGGNMGVAVADVVGKGVPASLLMASMRSALRVYAYFTYDIDRIMAEVNKHVCRETTIGEFVTVFYGVLTPDGKRLTYCNAGHDPPLLLRGGKLQGLRAGGMVLGVDPNAKFDRGLLHLQSGDVLCIYTDGTVEALNFADERFGRERLAASLQRYADQPAQMLATNMLWDIRRFRGLADRTDDLTMVVIKVR